MCTMCRVVVVLLFIVLKDFALMVQPVPQQESNIEEGTDLNEQLIHRQHHRSLLSRFAFGASADSQSGDAFASATQRESSIDSHRECKNVSFEVAFRDDTEVVDNFQVIRSTLKDIVSMLWAGAVLYDIFLCIIIILLAIVLIVQAREIHIKEHGFVDGKEQSEGTETSDVPESNAAGTASHLAHSSYFHSEDVPIDLYAIHEQQSPSGSRKDSEAQYIESCSSLFTETVKRKSSSSLFRSAGSSGGTIISPERTHAEPVEKSPYETPPRRASTGSGSEVQKRVRLQDVTCSPLFTRSPARAAAVKSSSPSAAMKGSPARTPLRPLGSVFGSGGRSRSTGSTGSGEKNKTLKLSSRIVSLKSSSSIAGDTGSGSTIARTADSIMTERQHADTVRQLHRQVNEAQEKLAMRDRVVAQLEHDLAMIRTTQSGALREIQQQLREQLQEVLALKDILRQREEKTNALVSDFTALGSEWLQSLAAQQSQASLVDDAPAEVVSDNTKETVDPIDAFFATMHASTPSSGETP